MIKVENKADVVNIRITGDILDDKWSFFDLENVNTYPKNIRNLLNDAKDKRVDVFINSGGGDLFAGIAISNMLKAHDKKTTAIIEGLAASSASIIAFGCDEIRIPSNAFLMMHKPSIYVNGNSDELLKWADTLDTLQVGIKNTYLTKAKENTTEEKIDEFINEETWFNGKKLSSFFNVTVTDDVKLKNNVGNCVYNYVKTPEIFMESKNSMVDELINKLKML